ncbi:transposase domain-containing protein [Gallibacterium genomosp. 1]|uniref:DDE endonuclease n=1 Tax=Gallibacterium genomosp. 1 TaxID=155515 RepID=A0AB36DUD2_9PAST|nr:transposase domain-containing protein [Gallibacterium genomosp. 1]OBW98144.1 DDE endonuclease [Gallibacterium genomosp. 1]OBW98681.1 DDE endonuclease [Gallibacterium genomosp. 1]
MEKWFSAQQLTEFKSLPNTPQGINKRAKLENWEKRQVTGKRGVSYEYSLTSLPQEVQAEIILKQAQANKPVSVAAPKSLNYLPDVIWAPWQNASDKQKSVAQYRLTIVKAIAALKETGLTSQKAIALVANEYNESAGTIKRWFYDVQAFEPSDWLPLLLDKKYAKRRQGEAEFTEAAWEAFKADYLRNEKPAFNVCYYRLQRAAQEQGWIIPSSQTVKRKLEREVPLAQQIYLREGEHALSRLYPAMQRSVAEIEAMEWINGDGYQHNVFVRWHNGDIVRPKTWIWQDIRTRKILAYRTDLSENSDTIRLSLMDVIYKYGIPRKLTIDNTRAAANKWMTGGVKNRYRFKVKEDDVVGIIPLLGIELYWTSIQFGKGHGQAKPIERAFSHGGLGELVDKHPTLAGYHAGDNIYNKPDNYNGGKDGVSYEDFILALEDGIRAFNEREGRETEMCQGVYSFNQIFERDYTNAHIRTASSEQLRLLMLMSEAVTLKKDGTFELNCGGKVHNRKNRYLATDLIASNHKKVIVKFDPNNLHGTVYVYSLAGAYLAEAICTEKVGFGDKATGREYNNAKRKWVKGNKMSAKALQTMNAKEAARYQPEFEEEEPLEPKIIEMIQQQGNTVRKVEVLADDEIDEFEQGWQKGLALLKQEKGL